MRAVARSSGSALEICLDCNPFLAQTQGTLLATNANLYWGGYDPTKDKGSSFEYLSAIVGGHDYVVSVQVGAGVCVHLSGKGKGWGVRVYVP